MIQEKTSAGGFETTTAEGNFTFTIIALCTRLKGALVHYAVMLAAYLRGLA